jgi:hypothetical protein
MSVAVSQHRRAAGRERGGAGVRPATRDLRAAALENRRCARRVRHEARDALGVVAFSAAASTGLTLLLTLLVALAGQGR